MTDELRARAGVSERAHHAGDSSPSVKRAYGVVRVCRTWGLSRATPHQDRQAVRQAVPRDPAWRGLRPAAMTVPLSWSMRFALALCAVFVSAALGAGGIAYVLQSRELAQRLAADVRATAESFARIAENGDRQDLIEQIDAQSLATHGGATLVAFIDGATGEAIGTLGVATSFAGAAADGRPRSRAGRRAPAGRSRRILCLRHPYDTWMDHRGTGRGLDRRKPRGPPCRRPHGVWAPHC